MTDNCAPNSSTISYHPPLNSLDHRIYYPGIVTTVTEVPRYCLPCLVQGRLRCFTEQRHCGDYHTRGAVTTLEGGILQEQLLHRMQRRPGCQPFESYDCPPFRFYGQHGA